MRIKSNRLRMGLKIDCPLGLLARQAVTAWEPTALRNIRCPPKSQASRPVGSALPAIAAKADDLER
jgi:hypothetical protein